MEKQELLNAIATISGSIDTLARAGKTTEIDTLIKKLLELVEKL